jgi:hypothetical protein
MDMVFVAYDFPLVSDVQNLALLGREFHEPVSLPLFVN